MKKEKRKERTGILLLFLTAMTAGGVGHPVYADAVQAAGSTAVSFQVDPAYEVTIPVDTQMQFNEIDADYGKIVIEEAKIDEGKCIQVSLESNLALKNQTGSEGKIPYRILSGEQPFTSAQYTTAGEETPLMIHIEKEDWKKAPAGTYADTVTFTVAYIDQSK